MGFRELLQYPESSEGILHVPEASSFNKHCECSDVVSSVCSW